MISKKALEEFKAIWRKEFHEDISDDKAMEQATSLLTLMNAVYRPIKKEWLSHELQNTERPTQEPSR